MSAPKKIICFDFDGVINDYKGWRDEGYNVILDEPVEGARKAIKKLRKKYIVLVNSTRCWRRGGRKAVAKWLEKHNIKVDAVTTGKPRADIYVDDRAINFDGSWAKLNKKIRKFKQWSY